MMQTQTKAKTRTVLVTGGTGYIGAHAAVELLAAGYGVSVIDNLSNSRIEAIDHIERICGIRPAFAEIDIRDGDALRALFARQQIDAVMHFAGLKAVGESVADPLRYYDNNVHGSLTLLQAMREAEVKCLVFSSSATVYGNPSRVPIGEDAPLRVTNPYGRSKLMIEDMLRDLAASDPQWRIALLRYFNPVGAHPSGLLGEDPRGVPNNLMPYALKVAAGLYPRLEVFGDDYATPDGTGVRDYVHVVDLALGHLAALRTLESREGVLTVNLGTGTGSSVMELIRTLAEVSGQPVPYQVVGRRPGDVAQCFADARRARELLGWKSQRDLRQMCADSWNWRKNQAEDQAEDHAEDHAKAP